MMNPQQTAQLRGVSRGMHPNDVITQPDRLQTRRPYKGQSPQKTLTSLVTFTNVKVQSLVNVPEVLTLLVYIFVLFKDWWRQLCSNLIYFSIG